MTDAIEEKTEQDASKGLLQTEEQQEETTVKIDKKSTRIGICRQVLVAALVTPVMISMAHMLAFPALLLPQLRNETDPLYMDREVGSWFTSINSLISPLGSLIGGFMMDRFGRKIALMTPIIPIIALWIITATAQSHALLFISRAFLGVCAGFVPPACQIYLAEITDAEFRGFTINVGYVSLTTGFLLIFTLGAVMGWRLLAWSGIVFPIVTLIGAIILPETPLWLIRNGQTERAYKILVWLRGDPNIARNELHENTARLNQEKDMAQNIGETRSWRDFLRPSVLKPTVIIFSFILLFNLTGTYLIIYYAIDILSQFKMMISPVNANVILSSVRLIVTVGFCWLFMRVNRRTIYLTAGIGSTISTLALSAYLFKRNEFSNESSMSLWLAGSLLLLFVTTNTGFIIAPGFLTGELLPAKIRGRLAGYIYTYFSIVTFILNKFFPLLNAYIELTGVLLVFGLASLATTALIYFMVPETRGRSLLTIEQYFENNGWIYKAKPTNQ